MKHSIVLTAFLGVLLPTDGFAQPQNRRAANGGFGTAINAILPGA